MMMTEIPQNPDQRQFQETIGCMIWIVTGALFPENMPGRVMTCPGGIGIVIEYKIQDWGSGWSSVRSEDARYIVLLPDGAICRLYRSEFTVMSEPYSC